MKNMIKLCALVLLYLAAMLSLVSCEALMGAARSVDPQALATAVVDGLVPELAKIKGMTPDALAEIAAQLKAAIVNSIPAPEASEGMSMWQQLLGYGVTAVATYFGVNIRRDAKYLASKP